jgi:hypothetical protein
MGTLLRKLQKNQQGQALAEYHILIPGVLVLALAAAWILGPNISDIYRHVTSVLTGPLECVAQYNHDDNSICDQNDLCEKVEYEDEESGEFTYQGALTIDSVVIKAGKTYEIVRDDPFKFTYTTSDSCYQVTFKTNSIEWKRVGSGPGCQAVSHIDHWQAPICTSQP